MELPAIPREYIAILAFILLAVLAMLNIDGWVHASIGMILGYYFSRLMELKKQ